MKNLETVDQEKKPEIKLLVVDDRVDNLLSIETILEKDGYVIKKATSGRAALRILLKEYDFTLILMDVQMPDMNGFETAMLIYERELLKQIPIIFITANDHTEDSIYKGYEMGGVDYINKPINPDLLRAKVAIFVELYFKNHQLIAQEKKLTEANKRLEQEIEERKSSEEKVRLLNKQLTNNIFQLENTNKDLERFAYIASHDLQEPLRKIIIFGDMLTNKYKVHMDEEGRNYLDRMVKASLRMQMLIKNILAFSRSSTQMDNFEETDLNMLLENILSDLEVYIEQKKAVFNISKLPTLKVIPTQFRQLVQNLVMNALKFSQKDRIPEITIAAEISKGGDIDIEGAQPDEYYCILSFKDNGIGFEQKYVDQIFMIFKRLHTFDEIEGTGIGLSICKKIVEQHNGFISATGIINQGSTFKVFLPVNMGIDNIAANQDEVISSNSFGEKKQFASLDS